MANIEIVQSSPSGNESGALVPFMFGQEAVRVVDLNGEAWFVARDVAKVLKYANVQEAVRRHCKAARKVGGACSAHPSHGLDPQTLIIPERDIYRLVMRSKLPEAERFEEWVVGEVLPSIRKTGGYSAMQPAATTMPAIPQTYSEALRLAADLAEKNVEQAKELEVIRPKVEQLHRIAEAEGSLCVTDAAKTLQIQPRSLFKYLRTNGWVYKRPGTTEDIGYQAKLQADLLEHKIVTVFKEDGSPLVVTQVRVTPKGLVRLAEELGS